MATVSAKPAQSKKPAIPEEQRFRISGIDWDTYESFGDLLLDRHIRRTYDRGELELMTVSPEQERLKTFIGRLIETMALVVGIEIAGYGSITSKRKDLERGFEPDECYWIANEAKIRGRTNIDIAVDPPPDLVVEVEISRSALDRMALYASLGAPEVWRCDEESFRVCLLNPQGVYKEKEKSKAFPFLPIKEFASFVGINKNEGQTQHLRKFQDWVRSQMDKGWKV